MTDVERLEEMLRWCGQLSTMRFNQIRQQHPSAPIHELYALWNERMYRGNVPDHVLDAAIAEIRRRGAEAPPPFDK